MAVFAGGEFGGVIWFGDGIGPGGQKGMCLFGTGVVDREVFNVSAGAKAGGVLDRS